MMYLENTIDEEHAYILPIGDVHLNDAMFTKKSLNKLKGYIEWVKGKNNARVFILGDLFNTLTRYSVSSPFKQNPEIIRRQEKEPSFREIDWAVELFEPIKDKIVGCVIGNHEMREEDFVNNNPLIEFSKRLDVTYCGISAVVNFKVNKRSDGKRYRESYIGYFMHTTGGGSSIGGKLNRVNKMRELVAGCDFYCGGHNHALITAPVSVGMVNRRKKKVEFPRQVLVDCGHYLEWSNSYAEYAMLPVGKMGSPRIRLSGTKHDIHTSI